MPENPLLPNRRLKELYDVMQRCALLERKSSHKLAREAMIAAVSVHLVAGDLLCGAEGDGTVRAFAPAARANELAEGKSVAVQEASTSLPKISRLGLCAAMARGLQASGAGGVVVAFAETGKLETAWVEAIEYGQRAQVPLLLICADANNRRAGNKASALHWPAVSKLAAKLKLPLLPVDGEDAVAIYRVMQECTARARMGEGPAILWCVLTPNGRAKVARAQQPLERMKQYLAVRGLLGASAKPRKRARK